MFRSLHLFLIFVLVVAAFVAVCFLPVAAAPVSQSGTQLLANPDFASDVAMWEPSYSDDCGEYPVWLDQSFFPDDSYFGLAIPDENCSGLSNGLSQSFYVSGYVGSTYVLAVSGYSYCSRTIEVYLDDLVSGQTAFHSGSGFHAPSITGVITDDSAPWSVTVQWNNSCSFPDETWLDSIHFTAYAPTPTPTETPTNTPEPTETSTPTETPTNTLEPFPTSTPTLTPTPSPGGGGTTVFFPAPGVLVIPLAVLLFEPQPFIFMLYMIFCAVLLPSNGDGVAVGSLYWLMFLIPRRMVSFFMERLSGRVSRGNRGMSGV